MKVIVTLYGSDDLKFRFTNDELLGPGDDTDAESLYQDPNIEDFIAARDAHREMMEQYFEKGIRTVERCHLIKSKAGRKYRQRSEHGRGKGKRTKQWELDR